MYKKTIYWKNRFQLAENTYNRLLKENQDLKSDNSDMYNAYQTSFYRCSCGHLREKGIRCPNNECKGDD